MTAEVTMKSEAKFGTVLTRLIIALVLIFVLGCDSGSGGGGGDTKSVKCLENDIVGPWILDWDTRADDSYIEFGTGGEIKGFQGIGTLSGTNPYTINGDCTFEG